MNPTTALVGVLFWLGTVVAGYFYGVGVGQDTEIAAQSREEKFAAVATEAAASAAANAISNLKVRHVTIKQQAETVIRDNPVYRDCVHPDGMLDTINQARGYEPAGRSVLPAASAPR